MGIIGRSEKIGLLPEIRGKESVDVLEGLVHGSDEVLLGGGLSVG